VRNKANSLVIRSPLSFLKNANSGAAGPTVQVTVPQFGGGIENVQFLAVRAPWSGGQKQLPENAETAVVYATFWIETETPKLNPVASSASGRRIVPNGSNLGAILD
jgi:hypothetical protein